MVPPQEMPAEHDTSHRARPAEKCFWNKEAAGAANRGCRALPVAIVATALALLGPGCALKSPREELAIPAPPRPPAFLAGPSGFLLANSGGFSALVTVETRPPDPAVEPLSGRLVARGDKFFFEPGGPGEGEDRANRFGYIWDGGAHRGFVLSEELQGYAALDSPLRFTNLVAHGSPAGAGRIQGHPAEEVIVTVFSGEGAPSTFLVARALDLGGLPLRIVSNSPADSSTITLRDIRPETPPESLFRPPEGFTPYPSPEALANELAYRDARSRRRWFEGARSGEHFVGRRHRH